MPKTTFSSGSPTPTPSPSPSPSSKQQQPPPPPPSKSTSKKRGILLSGTEEATVQERMLAQLAALNDSILPLPSTSAAFVVELRFSDIFKFFICQQNLNLTYKETAAAEQGGGGGGVRDGTGAMRDFNATANPPTALPPSSNNTFLSFFWSSTSTPNTASSYKATVASNNKGRTDSDIIEASKLLEVQRRLALVRRLRLILDLNLDAIPSPSPLEDFASSLSASFPLLVSLDLQMIDQAEISPRLYHPLLEKILEIKLNNVNLVILDSTEESPSYSPLCPAAEEVDLVNYKDKVIITLV